MKVFFWENEIAYKRILFVKTFYHYIARCRLTNFVWMFCIVKTSWTVTELLSSAAVAKFPATMIAGIVGITRGQIFALNWWRSFTTLSTQRVWPCVPASFQAIWTAKLIAILATIFCSHNNNYAKSSVFMIIASTWW